MQHSLRFAFDLSTSAAESADSVECNNFKEQDTYVSKSNEITYETNPLFTLIIHSKFTSKHFECQAMISRSHDANYLLNSNKIQRGTISNVHCTESFPLIKNQVNGFSVYSVRNQPLDAAMKNKLNKPKKIYTYTFSTLHLNLV